MTRTTIDPVPTFGPDQRESVLMEDDALRDRFTRSGCSLESC